MFVRCVMTSLMPMGRRGIRMLYAHLNIHIIIYIIINTLTWTCPRFLEAHNYYIWGIKKVIHNYNIYNNYNIIALVLFLMSLTTIDYVLCCNFTEFILTIRLLNCKK